MTDLFLFIIYNPNKIIRVKVKEEVFQRWEIDLSHLLTIEKYNMQHETAFSKFCFTKNTKAFLLLLLLISSGVILRIDHLHEEIGGHHIFRQSHVANDIISMKSNEYKPVLERYNKTSNHEISDFNKGWYYRVFDFPLYQFISAQLSDFTGISVVLAGRLTNIAVYIISVLLLASLMNEMAIGLRQIFFTLSLYSFSPLLIMYHRAIIPDNLAIALAFSSLLFFVKFTKNNQNSSYYLMLLTGILASIIKNPVYLPVAISISFYYVINRKWSELFSKKTIIFYVLILASIMIFKTFSNFINTGGGFQTPEWEFRWYFGTLNDRLNFSYWDLLFKRSIALFSVPLIPYAFCCGIIVYVFHEPFSRYKPIITGLLLGSIITVLIFFNVNWRHDYYQLPYLFIYCYLAAYFIDFLYDNLHRRVISKIGVNSEAAMLILSLMFIVFLFISGRNHLPDLSENKALIANAEVLRKLTEPDSFIFTVASSGWDPTLHYFTRRHGYTISYEQFTYENILNIFNKYRDKYAYPYILILDENMKDEPDILNRMKHVKLKQVFRAGKFVVLYKIKSLSLPAINPD